MARSPIKIDTDIQGIKRGLPYDGTEASDDLTVPADQDHGDPRVTEAASRLPPFMNLPYIGKTIDVLFV